MVAWCWVCQWGFLCPYAFLKPTIALFSDLDWLEHSISSLISILWRSFRQMIGKTQFEH